MMNTQRLLAYFEPRSDEMLAIIEGLDGDDWGGFLVPHKYMGPLPSCFYPVAQLVDYTVHTWDIRQGTGRAHAIDGDAADLLVPFCFIVWQSTAQCADVEPFTVGVRVSGNSGGDTRAAVTAEGVSLEPGDLDDLPVVLEFDAASMVLKQTTRKPRKGEKLSFRFSSHDDPFNGGDEWCRGGFSVMIATARDYEKDGGALVGMVASRFRAP